MQLSDLLTPAVERISTEDAAKVVTQVHDHAAPFESAALACR